MGKKKLTIEEVKERLNEINPNVDIIDDIYVNSKEKLRCKCKICNNEWRVRWNDLRKGIGCPACANNSRRLALTNNIEEMKSKSKEIHPNLEIDFSGYINARTKINCKCKIDGYEWGARWNDLQRGVGCPKCSGTKKLTIEEVKERISEINQNVEILSDEYINTNTKLLCRCKIDRHKWYVRWNDLQKGIGCPKCGGTKKLTIEEVKEKLREINSNIEILSTEYVNNETKLLCRCKIDGYEWTANWASLSRMKGCPECSGNRTDYTIEDIKEKLSYINNDIKILNDTYINNATKFRCRCLKCGNEWMSHWNNLQQGSSCPKCACKNRGIAQKNSIDKMRKIAKELHQNIDIDFSDYMNAYSKLKCRCRIDGHEWSAVWHNLQKGHGCPICAKELSGGSGGDGGYSTTLAERNKEEWMNKYAIVYLIECNNDDEHFYKIGITTKTVNERFRGCLPYDYKILNTIETNLYDAVYLEENLHLIHKEYSYIPLQEFGGYTECFSELII